MKREFDGSTIGRSKSQQEIDTRIDRSAAEIQKRESSDGIHELRREGVCRNTDRLGGIWPGGEYPDHHAIPKVAGEDEKDKEARPKEKKRKQNLWKSN